jgi:hypothetical protein
LHTLRVLNVRFLLYKYAYCFCNFRPHVLISDAHSYLKKAMQPTAEMAQDDTISFPFDGDLTV